MSRILLALAMALVAALSASIEARSECPGTPAAPLEEGQIGLFFDPGGTQNCVDVPPTTPFQLYVVARVPEGGIAEFESPTLLQTSGPAVFLTSSVAPSPGYEPLLVADGCFAARRTDSSSCPVAQSDLLPLSVIDILTFNPQTGSYCFESACASISGEQARPPFYWRCDDGTLHSFTGGDSMCIGIGESPVTVQRSTWTTVKTLYVDE